jgi:hypothetical protein
MIACQIVERSTAVILITRQQSSRPKRRYAERPPPKPCSRKVDGTEEGASARRSHQPLSMMTVSVCREHINDERAANDMWVIGSRSAGRNEVAIQNGAL